MTLRRQLGLALLTTLLAVPAAAQTVHRCTVGGRTVYQQVPCAAGSASATVDVAPNIVAGERPAAAASAAPVTPSGAQALSVAGGDLNADVAACLAYLRTLLRNPDSARASNPSKNARVLSLTLQAANSRGRNVQRAAACEVRDGKLDEGWTRTHLKRLGWFSAPLQVLPDAGSASRPRPPFAELAELDDIERP